MIRPARSCFEPCRGLALAACLFLLAPTAEAADSGAPGWAAARPDGVVSLSASATIDVPKDWISITFSTTRDGADAGAVQSAVRQAVEAALAQARESARGDGHVEVETGAFSLQPRYSSKGQPSGWQGQAELVVQGRDVTTIAQLAGRITTLTIERVDYSVSREAREKVESDLSAQAIARFRGKAADVAKAFGYSGWTVREVAVTSDSEQPPMPRPFMARAVSAAPADLAPALPVEGGKGTLTVTVNGTVQMTK